MKRPILFKCPQTGMKVQHWVDDPKGDSDDSFTSVECPACARLHYINLQTGKVLGQK